MWDPNQNLYPCLDFNFIPPRVIALQLHQAAEHIALGPLMISVSLKDLRSSGVAAVSRMLPDSPCRHNTRSSKLRWGATYLARRKTPQRLWDLLKAFRGPMRDHLLLGHQHLRHCGTNARFSQLPSFPVRATRCPTWESENFFRR